MWNDYVSVPTQVRAVYWDGTDDVLHALDVVGCQHYINDIGLLRIRAGVAGAQQFVPVEVGDYILSDDHPALHFWPCHKDVFERKYKPKNG